ncbi:MAG: CHASE2 domain-containing protein [Bacteroidota bacterium]
MLKKPILLLLISLTAQRCNMPSVNLTPGLDPDIVLINIEKADREILGNLLIKLDSLNPKVIGIDVQFLNKKDPLQDSILASAFKIMRNDILGYGINKNGQYNRSQSMFTNYVRDEGLVELFYTGDMVSKMTPLSRKGGRLHHSFALKIVKYWAPAYDPGFAPDQKININYTKRENQFLTINTSDLLAGFVDEPRLMNKVLLVGYVGPDEEDKFFTPIRIISDEYKDGEPDTYGLVILANQVRTILEYRK